MPAYFWSTGLGQGKPSRSSQPQGCALPPTLTDLFLTPLFCTPWMGNNPHQFSELHDYRLGVANICTHLWMIVYLIWRVDMYSIISTYPTSFEMNSPLEISVANNKGRFQKYSSLFVGIVPLIYWFSYTWNVSPSRSPWGVKQLHIMYSA